jgi:hypothetical protein
VIFLTDNSPVKCDDSLLTVGESQPPVVTQALESNLFGRSKSKALTVFHMARLSVSGSAREVCGLMHGALSAFSFSFSRCGFQEVSL